MPRVNPRTLVSSWQLNYLYLVVKRLLFTPLPNGSFQLNGALSPLLSMLMFSKNDPSYSETREYYLDSPFRLQHHPFPQKRYKAEMANTIIRNGKSEMVGDMNIMFGFGGST